MKRNLGCLMKEHDLVMLKCHFRAHSMLLLLILGFTTLNGVPSMAEDLQAAYQQAASTSPAIAQARAQFDADVAGRPLARAALLPTSMLMPVEA